MKMSARILFCACVALASTGAVAQDPMKKGDAMSKDGMAKSMTTQECKDHMAMAKDNMKKDDAAMKKDAMCTEMMNKDAMMKKDGMAADPMKK